MKRPVPAPRAVSSVPYAPALLLAAVALIAPLLAGVPDEQVWTPVACALTLIAWAWSLLTCTPSSQLPAQHRAETLLRRSAAGVFVVALLSFLWRWLLIDHGATQFVDPMLRGVAYWSALAGLAYVGAVQVGRNRTALYMVLIAVVAAAGIASAMGLQDYLVSVFRRHIANWREFGTSTPDYFAGYLLITIPATLGLFLAAPSSPGRRIAWLYGFAFLLQLAVLPTTGSRFALISLIVGFACFVGVMLMLRARGATFDPSLRPRAILLCVLAVMGGIVSVGPLLHRLQSSAMSQQANSGAFRIYTWHGSLDMALHHPILGVGPNLYVYEFPKYALAGFTRLAHSGYLQVLDDLGPLGLIAVAALFGGCIWITLAALRRTDDPEAVIPAQPPSALLENVAPDTLSGEKIVLAGLISGAIAGLLQNVIDSDWNITIAGATLFLVAGLAAGLSARLLPETQTKAAGAPRVIGSAPWWRLGAAVAAVLLAALCISWSTAGRAESNGNLDEAVQFAPLDGDYHGVLGLEEMRAGQQGMSPGTEFWMGRAERHLTRAIELAPSAVEYRRRADLYRAQDRLPEALADVNAGLTQCDPHSLELLLLGGQVEDASGNRAAALSYYSKMTAMQQQPYGTLQAVTELTEYRYAFADAALGADALQRRDLPTAIDLLQRARTVLEAYVAEGGSANALRAQIAGSGAAALDVNLQSVYGQVMDNLAQAYTLAGRPQDAQQTKASEASELPKFIHAPAQPGSAG